MTFLSPLFLLALGPVMALALAYMLTQRRRQRFAVRFSSLPMLARIVPKRPAWRKHLPAGLILLCLTCLGFAAARPEVSLRVPYERATVIVAIDTSGSMLADDVAPDRLDAAKTAAAAFVDDLPDTFNVGVVEFAGTASVVAPATTDHAQVERSIAAITSGGGGTAIGESVYEALAEASRLSTEGGSNESRAQRGDSSGSAADGTGRSETPGSGSSNTVDRIPARLVVLSDGANTAGRSPDQAAQAANDAGMPVSTISFGTPEGMYGTLAVPVDESTLRELANDTDGNFYQAASTQELREVYGDIGSSIGWHEEPVDITPYLALAGLLVACVAGALSLRWFSRLV